MALYFSTSVTRTATYSTFPGILLLPLTNSSARKPLCLFSFISLALVHESQKCYVVDLQWHTHYCRDTVTCGRVMKKFDMASPSALIALLLPRLARAK